MAGVQNPLPKSSQTLPAISQTDRQWDGILTSLSWLQKSDSTGSWESFAPQMVRSVTCKTTVGKKYQKRGAVHWHMLFWVKPGTAPKGVVLAEVPRGLDTSHPIAVYLRKVVLQMQMHGKCNSNRCFKGSYGKTLAKCQYGFPFPVPHNTEELDDEHIRYLYVRRHEEDKFVVPYNPVLDQVHLQA